MNSLTVQSVSDPLSGATGQCAVFSIDAVVVPYTLSKLMATGTEYTLSFWLRSDAEGSVRVLDNSFASTTSWTKHSHTFTSTGDSLSFYFDTVGTYYLYHAKLEVGNTPTDWSPAPEDASDEISRLRSEISELTVTTKGVNMTSENANGTMATFIGNQEVNGVSTGVWEAKYTRTGSTTPSSQLYFDFANGKFVFDGEVNARSGTLGDLTIDGHLYFGGNEEYYITANYDDNDYYIYLPGFEVDEASGAVFSGTLSAPSGKIGGFNIGSTYLSTNNKTSYNDSTSGVYVGNTGIGLGAGKFYVDSNGYLVSTSGKIGGFNIGSTYLSTNNKTSYNDSTSGVYVGNTGIGLGAGKFYVDSNGYLYAGWGTIGAWNVLQSGILGSASNTSGKWLGIALDSNASSLSNPSTRVLAVGQLGSGEESSAEAAINGSWANAAFSIKADGSIYASAGKITGNVEVDAVTVKGELTAASISADKISGTQLSGKLIYVPESMRFGEYTDNGTWIDGCGLSVFSGGEGIRILNNEIAYTSLDQGKSSRWMIFEHDTATLNGSWVLGYKLRIGNTNGYIQTTRVNSTLYPLFIGNDWYFEDCVCLGTGSDDYQLCLSKNTISFDYNGSTPGWITTDSSGYVGIYGTFRTNGSAWISSSDVKAKNTISDLTDDHDVLFDNLHPRTYKWNEGTSDRTHSGFIVQEVVDAIESAGLTTKDFAAVVAFGDQNDETTEWGLRYEELISLNTWQIQKLKARVAELEDIIHKLKENPE